MPDLASLSSVFDLRRNLGEVAEQRKHKQGFEEIKVGCIDRLSIVCLISIGRHLSHIYEAAGLPVQVMDFYKAYKS